MMTRDVKIDFARAGGVDLGRLGRSLLLHGERVGEGRYHVTGGEHDHWVDLYTTSHPRCDCGDHLWREQVCKHILAALLREGHTPVVDALGVLFRGVMDARKAAWVPHVSWRSTGKSRNSATAPPTPPPSATTCCASTTTS